MGSIPSKKPCQELIPEALAKQDIDADWSLRLHVPDLPDYKFG
jgi:hypothetical protein